MITLLRGGAHSEHVARQVVPAEDSPQVPDVWGLLRTECSFSLNLAEALVGAALPGWFWGAMN